MISRSTILLFFIYLWGLGFSLTYFIRSKSADFWERHIMNLGIGLGTFCILFIIIYFFFISLYWKLKRIFRNLVRGWVIFPIFTIIIIFFRIPLKWKQKN